MFDNDYVVNMLHNSPINFSYDGNGNYTISQKDIAKLLKKQHNDTVKSIVEKIEKLIETNSSCVGVGYARTCLGIVNKFLR